ncbi:MAG: HmuY family protein [Saccharospirillum sp.]
MTGIHQQGVLMKTATSVFGLAAAIALAGCNDDSNKVDIDPENSEGTGAYRTIQLNSATGWAYLDFSTSEEVAESADWDIAVNRLSVRINPERAELALATSQDDFYDGEDPNVNVFTNATAGSELEHLLAHYDLTELAFEPESVDAAIGRDGTEFYNYNFITHTMSANPDAWWVLRSSDGDAFAKLNVTDVSYATGSLSIEAEFYVQAEGDSTFSNTANTWAATVSESECYDFDAGAVVGCDQSSWDIQLKVEDRSFRLLTNGGVSGDGDSGVHGALTQTEVDAITDGNGLITHQFSQDRGNNAITQNSWYAYNLTGRHGIWPNYRVYVAKNLDTDVATAFQLIGYYNEADVSGYVTVRFVELDELE